jgi:hypothetical protein
MEKGNRSDLMQGISEFGALLHDALSVCPPASHEVQKSPGLPDLLEQLDDNIIVSH